MAECLLCGQPDSVANHITNRSISDRHALTWLATETGWARSKRSAICSGKLTSGYVISYDVISYDVAFHPSGVGKWVPASAGKAKAGMVHSVSGWTRGVQVKLWDPLTTRAIPEHLRGVFTTRRYTNTRLPLPLPLPYHEVWHLDYICIGLWLFPSFKFSIITVWSYLVFAIIGSVFFGYFHYVCCCFVCCVA